MGNGHAVFIVRCLKLNGEELRMVVLSRVYTIHHTLTKWRSCTVRYGSEKLNSQTLRRKASHDPAKRCQVFR